MDKNDYKHKIEEHRKPIKLDGDDSANSRMSRRSSNQPVKQTTKSRNFLLPILFAIFILIPFGFLIYIQVFYEPNQNETAVLETGVFEYQQNEEDNEEENVANQEEESQIDEEEDSTVIEEETETDENSTEEPTVTEPEPNEEQGSSEKTHIVQPNETLYRIAMNYYNSPDAVERIKEANGLTTDSISTGQELILP